MNLKKTATRLLLVSLLAGGHAFAWVPKLDQTSAKEVIDSAYNRRDPLPTLLTLDLTVENGAFKTPGAVSVFDGDKTACLANWTNAPTDFATYGSRPVAVTLTGQADDLFLQAQEARNAFKNLSVKDALASGEGRLPDGHLRVYVRMQGLQAERLRDAYNVAMRAADGKVTAPYRRAFVQDWKQEGGRWSGTMVYYFDALKAGIKPNGKLDLLLRTEADTDCAYQITADLTKLY
ncbi:hypothetical protein HNR42_002159 [Deinobacterium chartae]|uniref:Uncharacterized protein n=1 Tax=Deinobacterium chartae TaxID=521158 RepID=A0A841I162_9DEIO|nr:hypothetical protein [Deinobacterium chartae]MBB6098724.1 hypothetical protein [Deinobacterium chartae]